MEILRRPIRELTFADVEAFLQEGIIEGIQLDYKKDFSDKGLAKHFAAFSNARGGLIIIGVVEDSATGKPITWEGIDPAGKPEDRIHQFANNVDPIPSYDVCTTDTNCDGKVFALVRIYEGDRTPYYVQNDATIYVRNGNVTKRFEEPASPQETVRLIGKRENARLSREIGVAHAENVYKFATSRFRKQWVRWHNANRPALYHDPVVPSAGACTLLLQPHFPDISLVSPKQLLQILQKMRLESFGKESWLCSEGEAMQGGVLMVNARITNRPLWSACQQYFSSGLVFGREAIATTLENSEMRLELQNLVDELYYFLITARVLYQTIQYQGGLVGSVKLTGLEAMQSKPFAPTKEDRFEPLDILLPTYEWPVVLDTSILFKAESLKAFFLDAITEINFSFGWNHELKEFLDYYAKKNGWFVF